MSGEGKRKHDAGGREDGNQRKRKARHHARQVQGPGIFVSCVRGKERKAAHELIDFLEEIADRIYPDVAVEEQHQQQTRDGVEGQEEQAMDALRNEAKGEAAEAAEAKPIVKSDKGDIEDQIQAELADFKGKGRAGDGQNDRRMSRFTAVMTDMECFFFISVNRAIDPVKVTYALLDDVKRTGQTRSRFVLRLSPVYDTVHADADNLSALTDRILAKHMKQTDAWTFKVDVKARLHAQMAKMDIIHTLAGRMPSQAKAQLKDPDVVVSVEVFRMTAGVALLRDFESYRRLNPHMLAEQFQKGQVEDQTSRTAM